MAQTGRSKRYLKQLKQIAAAEIRADDPVASDVIGISPGSRST